MIDYILIGVILAILAGAGTYVYKAKKSGKKCIGCPDGCCGCSGGEKNSRCGCGK